MYKKLAEVNNFEMFMWNGNYGIRNKQDETIRLFEKYEDFMECVKAI